MLSSNRMGDRYHWRWVTLITDVPTTAWYSPAKFTLCNVGRWSSPKTAVAKAWLMTPTGLQECVFYAVVDGSFHSYQ